MSRGTLAATFSSFSLWGVGQSWGGYRSPRTPCPVPAAVPAPRVPPPLTSGRRRGLGAGGSSRCHRAGPPAAGCSHRCCGERPREPGSAGPSAPRSRSLPVPGCPRSPSPHRPRAQSLPIRGPCRSPAPPYPRARSLPLPSPSLSLQLLEHRPRLRLRQRPHRPAPRTCGRAGTGTGAAGSDAAAAPGAMAAEEARLLAWLHGPAGPGGP